MHSTIEALPSTPTSEETELSSRPAPAVEVYSDRGKASVKTGGESARLPQPQLGIEKPPPTGVDGGPFGCALFNAY